MRLRYHVTNRLKRIPVIGGMPRYLITLGGTANAYPISLAPYDSVRAFPVFASGRSPILLRGDVAALFGGASLRIDSIRVERVPLSRINVAWMADALQKASRTATRDSTE